MTPADYWFAVVFFGVPCAVVAYFLLGFVFAALCDLRAYFLRRKIEKLEGRKSKLDRMKSKLVRLERPGGF